MTPSIIRAVVIVIAACATLAGTQVPVHASSSSAPATLQAVDAQPGTLPESQRLRDTLARPPLESEAPLPREPHGWQASLDAAMGAVNGAISAVFFFDLIWWRADQTLPLVVAWLVLAAIFLTLRMRFINIRAFRHAIAVTRGRYTDPSEPGEVSHFQALSTALSATVGLGNIAGVAIAISIGGPGATFWMIVAGFLGMTTKFAECTLAVAYRDVGSHGTVLGGPMQYLSKGFAERGLPRLGQFLAVAFAILCIGGSLGGGNSFQVNQSMNALQETVPALADNGWYTVC